MQIYLPIAEISVNLLLLLSLGVGVGFLSGMFGVGGGFLLTPLLIFIGIPPAVAVSTQANQIAASSASGAIAHWRRGTLDIKMGLLLLVGGMAGAVAGVQIFGYLQALGQIDLIISLCYVGFLGTIGTLMLDRGLFPLVDLAYQGLGFGLEEDAEPVRHLASVMPEMVVAASCSKNFAVYRDRVGAAFILASSAAAADVAGAKLATIGRGMWSMPPDHGAAAVKIVLEDEGLRANWKAELDGMRERIQMLRANLASELTRLTNSDFSFVTRQTGMFSCLPLTDGQAQRLRDERGVYLLPDGRINVAGLNAQNTAPFAKAFAETR